MKTLLIILVLFGTLTACKRRDPIETVISKDGNKICISVEYTTSTGRINTRIYESVKLTESNDGRIKNSQGVEWTSLDEAVQHHLPDLRARLEATLKEFK